MRTSGWKLTALVGVVGVGLMLILQAQQSLTRSDLKENDDVLSSLEGDALALPVNSADHRGPRETPEDGATIIPRRNRDSASRSQIADNVQTNEDPWGSSDSQDNKGLSFSDQPEPSESESTNKSTGRFVRPKSMTAATDLDFGPAPTNRDAVDPFAEPSPQFVPEATPLKLTPEPLDEFKEPAAEPAPIRSPELTRIRSTSESELPATEPAPRVKSVTLADDPLDPFGRNSAESVDPPRPTTISRPPGRVAMRSRLSPVAVDIDFHDQTPIVLGRGEPVTVEEPITASRQPDNSPRDRMPADITRSEWPARTPKPDIPVARMVQPASGLQPGVEEEAVIPSRKRSPAEISSRPSVGTRDFSTSIGNTQAVQQPNLLVEKQAPERAILGQPVVYTLVVTNAGKVEARDVVVEDQIPGNSELEGATPEAEMRDRRMVWRLGTLRPGETQKIKVRVIPREAGSLGSIAKVSFATEVAAAINVTAPRLDLIVSGPQQVKMGQTVSLVYQVKNIGTVEAEGVELVEVIPDGLSHPEGRNIMYPIGQLMPGQTTEVTLDLLAIKSGPANGRVLLTTGGVTAVEKEVPVLVVSEKFALERLGPGRPYAGRSVTYENVLRNTGDSEIEGLTLSELIPAGFEFEEASHGGRYDRITRMVNWKLPRIALDEERRVAVKLKARNSGDLTSVVTAVSTIGATAKVQHTAELYGLPAMTLEPISNQRTVAIGEEVIIRVQVDNRGAAIAKNVVLEASIPPEFEFLEAAGPADYAIERDRVRFPSINQFNIDQPVRYEFKLRAKKPGDSHVEFAILADHLQRALRRDEAILVVP